MVDDRLLRTARLQLRPMVPSDQDALHALWTAPGVRRFLWDDEIISPAKTAEVIATSEALFQERGYGLWAVRPHGGVELAGFAGIWPFREPPEYELLYGLAEPEWGRGYAVEAAEAVLSYCFGPLNMASVRASTDAANTASVRVLEKLGFTSTRRETVNGLDTMFFERAKKR
jgi:RimJ/RimL family protein N-acetyltransferase